MASFDFRSAADLDEAIALLAAHTPHVRVIAGGTDVMVEMKETGKRPQFLVDITRIEALRGIELTAEGLRIGALTTHDEIMRSASIGSHCPVLAQAARSIGAVQTRNLGTIGGNLVSAVPSMDSGPALVVLDAVVTLASAGGVRTVPLERLWLGARKSVLAPTEILVSVLVPRSGFDKFAAFLKFGLRKGQALALVNVAAACDFEAPDGVCRNVRIALGAVAPTVFRAREAERYLEGRSIGADRFEAAARIAADEARPISDLRATADYRRSLARVLTRRALESAWLASNAAAEETRACAG